MSPIEYQRRYEVQIANTVAAGGRDLQGRWEYHCGYHFLEDAKDAAEQLSEYNRWVRVFDTNEHTDR